jgi:hypothetical protein
MTSEDVTKLAGSLSGMAAQCERMAEQAGFVNDGYIRVRDPVWLIDKLREAAAALTTLSATIEELRTERNALRKALIETGRLAGGGLADNVSSEFLAHVPAQVNGKLTELREALGREREECAKVASNYAFDNSLAPLHSNQAVAWNVSQNIAAAIRSRTTGDVDG